MGFVFLDHFDILYCACIVELECCMVLFICGGREMSFYFVWRREEDEEDEDEEEEAYIISCAGIIS